MNQTYYQKRNDFSEAHYKLPRSYGMFDIDTMLGQWLELQDNVSTKDESTYIEYECLKFDKDQNRFNDDRIKYHAVFELKYKGNGTLKEKMKMNPGEPLWAVFMMAKRLQCRFFLVVADNGKSPFHFIEYCTKKNERLPYLTLHYDYKTDDSDLIKNFWNNSLKLRS